MRDIKFRQPITNSDDKFVRWHYWGFIDGVFVSPAGYGISNKETADDSQQYTGRKDINGNEIYEGDVLKCDISMLISSTLPHMGLVVYVDRLCSFATKNDAGETLFVKHVSNTREVIGNIHENPELLS